MPSAKQKLTKLQHAANSFGSMLGRHLIRKSPELGFRMIPKPVLEKLVRTAVASLVAVFGTDFLRGNDGQAFIADLFTFLIPERGLRDSLSLIITEIIEEMVKNQNDFGDDPDDNKERAREIIEGVFGRKGMSSGDKKTEKSVKPSERTVLQVVGELEPAQQRDWWLIVTRLQQRLNGGQINMPNIVQPGDEITRLINRVALTKEQVVAIIAASPASLQEDLLLQALRQGTAAGGATGGFGRLWDRAVGMVESAMPTGGSAGNASADLKALVERREREDDDISGIR